VAERDDELVERLRAVGSVFAEDEADVLTLSASSPEHLEEMTRRRIAGEPLEVVVGWAEFCGLRVVVEPGVFVPRARTAILVDEGSRVIGPDSVVVDLCCGTGAVGLALHDRQPRIELFASDIDPAAVRCARRNLGPLGARVLEGDLFDALPEDLRGRVDLLVVNAPYVPTDAIATMPPEARDHEPHVALDGGADGVEIHRRVAIGARDWLAPGGHVVIETSRGQADLTAAALATGGLRPTVVSSEENDGTAVIGSRDPSS
jgi:release factor glutamine methyltransferase